MKAKQIFSVAVTVCMVLSMILIMPSYAKTSEIIWCETFENGVDDWIFFDADGDSDNWNLLNTDSSGFASYRGDYLLASDSLSRSPDNYAVSPAIEVSREKIGDMDALSLSWYRRALSSYSYAENYTVYVYKEKTVKPVTVDEVKNGSEQLYTERLSSGGKYERISVDFSSYIGETVRLVFRHHDCPNLQAIMLDDISIDASYTNASRTFFGFEDGTDGWSFIDADGDKSNWSVTSAFSYEGQRSLVSYSYRASAYNPKNYAISPTIGVSGNSHLQLDWYAGASSQNTYKEHYAVYIYTGSDTPTAESISALEPVFEETLDTYEYTKKTVDLDPYIGYDSIRVIFYHYIPEGGSAQSRLLIDNVTVTGVAKQSHNATFLVDGAAYGDVKLYAEGDLIVAPDAPTKTGYTFTGWDPAVDTMGTADITFNAKFEAKTYNVTFMNGDTQHAAKTVKYDGAYTVPDADPTKAGYTFAGWVDASGNAMPATHTTDGDVTFYAKWSTSAFDAKFYLDAAKTVLHDTKSVEFGAAIPKPDKDPSKTGYTFNGWSLNGSTVLADLGTMDTEGKDFIAVFESKGPAVIFYDGDTVLGTKTGDFGSAVGAIDDPSKAGYTFAGWKYADGSDATFPITLGTDPVAVYAQWTANPICIEFYDGSNFLSGGKQYCGDELEAPDDPTKAGYKFVGWFDADGNEMPATVPTADAKYYAKYEAATYTVTFKPGDEVVSSAEALYGSTIVAPDDPTKEGNTFKGWAVEGTTDIVTFDDTTTVPVGGVTYVAIFEVNSYKITYYVDNVIVHEDTVKYGAAIPEYTYTPAEGASFGGWTTAIPETMPADDLSIYGTTATNTYTVTFTINGEEHAKVSYAYGATVTAPAYTSHEGYIFSGWNLPETMPAQDIVLDATLTKNSYFLKYYLFEGDTEAYKEYTVPYGDKMPIPDAPSKPGYEFQGWDYEGLETATMPAQAVNIYANMYQEEYAIEFEDADGTIKSDWIGHYGDVIEAKDVPEVTKEGSRFIGWTVNGSAVTFPYTVTGDTTFVPEFSGIAIVGYTENKYVDYRTTITLKAESYNAPDGAEIYWYVNGKYQGKGETFTLKEVKANCTVQAKCVLNRETVSESGEETINVNTGFFAKLVAFFKGLFGTLPNIEQY